MCADRCQRQRQFRTGNLEIGLVNLSASEGDRGPGVIDDGIGEHSSSSDRDGAEIENG